MKKNPPKYTDFFPKAPQDKVSAVPMEEADRHASSPPALSLIGDDSSGGKQPPRDSGKHTRRRVKKPRRWYDYALDALIAALLLGGLYLILRPLYVKYERTKISNELLDMVKHGKTDTTITYNPRKNRLSEAEYDQFSYDKNGAVIGAKNVTKDPPELAYLTPIGRLKIPTLNIDIPIIKEMDYDAMFYGASHWNESVMPGETGNAVLFMHRSSHENYEFKNADKLVKGDRAIVDCNGHEYVLELFDIHVIPPVELPDTLTNQHQTGKNMTIVTCTPPVTFENRLLLTFREVSDTADTSAASVGSKP